MSSFGTVITAMVTPFDKNGKVDYKRAAELANYLIDNGSDSIVVHGTTGESPTLSHEEEHELYKTVLKAIKGKAKMIAGTGSNSTAETIEATAKAEKLGVDAALTVVPYYNKPSQEGLYQHFSAVAASTKLPIILYNIPGRTVVNMNADTVARLAKIKNIIGVKECGELDQVSAIRAKTPKEFTIYSGDDDRTLEMMKRGGNGVISVASHIAGKDIKKMSEAFKSGKLAEAEALNAKLAPLFKVLFIAPNPTCVKSALAMIGQPVGGLRLPLIECNDSEKEQIRTVLKELKLL
jgi:4-hydroxy-tetrahydrodipicolinate synthase